MNEYILKRIGQGVVAVFLLLTAMFFLTRLTGDPVYLFVDDYATHEDIALMRARLGLDEPLPEQFRVYLVGVVTRGDLGDSIALRRSALQIFFERFPTTLKLVIPSILFATVCAIPLGVIAASRRGGVIDRLCTGLAAFGLAAPNFWIGILLIFIFAVWLGLLPSARPGGLSHYVLPVLTLGTALVAAQMRLLRSSMLDALDSEYVKLARIKGVSERKVIWWHAFRNSILTMFTYAALQLAVLITGAIVTETVFAWPGVGRLVYDAIRWADYPLIQTLIVMGGIFIIVINLVVDMAYAYIDPRIRHEPR